MQNSYRVAALELLLLARSLKVIHTHETLSHCCAFAMFETAFAGSFGVTNTLAKTHNYTCVVSLCDLICVYKYVA